MPPSAPKRKRDGTPISLDSVPGAQRVGAMSAELLALTRSRRLLMQSAGFCLAGIRERREWLERYMQSCEQKTERIAVRGVGNIRLVRAQKRRSSSAGGGADVSAHDLIASVRSTDPRSAQVLAEHLVRLEHQQRETQPGEQRETQTETGEQQQTRQEMALRVTLDKKDSVVPAAQRLLDETLEHTTLTVPERCRSMQTRPLTTAALRRSKQRQDERLRAQRQQRKAAAANHASTVNKE